MTDEPLTSRLSRIRLLLLDVDGVLTDGRVVWHDDGIEQKAFHIRDGLGIRLWRRAGGKVGIITGRSSHVVELRARELGIDVVRQGVDDKLESAAGVLSETGCGWEEAAFVGDDLPDLPVILGCGVGFAVADACAEVRAAADHVTTTAGGRGAVREIVEMMLKARGSWDAIVGRYASAPPAARDDAAGRSP